MSVCGCEHEEGHLRNFIYFFQNIDIVITVIHKRMLIIKTVIKTTEQFSYSDIGICMHMYIYKQVSVYKVKPPISNFAAHANNLSFILFMQPFQSINTHLYRFFNYQFYLHISPLALQCSCYYSWLNKRVINANWIPSLSTDDNAKKHFVQLTEYSYVCWYFFMNIWLLLLVTNHKICNEYLLVHVLFGSNAFTSPYYQLSITFIRCIPPKYQQLESYVNFLICSYCRLWIVVNF